MVNENRGERLFSDSKILEKTLASTPLKTCVHALSNIPRSLGIQLADVLADFGSAVEALGGPSGRCAIHSRSRSLA
jgi:hypothetical protein